MKMVRDNSSRTGWSALVLLRHIKIRGPLAKSRYVLAERDFTGKQKVNFGGHGKRPHVSLTIDWQPTAADFQMMQNKKRLERARALSPTLK